MTSFDEERQGLIEAAVEELREKTAGLDRKAAKYDRKTAQLEKALAILQNKQLYQQQWQERHRRRHETGDVDLDNIESHLSFRSEMIHQKKELEHHDGESSFIVNPITSLISSFGNRKPKAKRSEEGEEERADPAYPTIHEKEDGNLHLQADSNLHDEMKLLRDRITQIENSDSANQSRRRSSLFASALPSLLAQESSTGQERGTIVLERDVFSIMMRSKIFSKGWFLGIFCFNFQVALVVFGPIFSYNIDFNNPPHLPSGEVIIVQYLTLILSLFTQTDLLSSVHLIFLLLRIGDRADWNTLINYEDEVSHNRRFFLRANRIIIPNILKLVQGGTALVATWFISIQSVDGAELLMNYAALLVISQTDNVMFVVADYGFLGKDLANAADDVKSAQIEADDNLVNGRCVGVSKLVFMATVLTVMISLHGFITVQQSSGRYFYTSHPYCNIALEDIPKIGDGYCDGGLFNTIACGFDGGDCVNFILEYPNCNATRPELLGNNECNPELNIVECNFDGSDCCPFDYGVNGTDPRLGDGVCDGGQFFTLMCNYDEFDCQDLRSRVGRNRCDFEALANLVDVNHIPRFGDGVCDSGVYNNAECLFEDGDCIECNAQVHDVLFTGDGVCHGGAHNSQVCNWDAGDCFEFNEKYPLCMVNKTLAVIQNNATMKHVPIIGDGICNSGLYNNDNCGYEDGDCHACNAILDEKGLDRMKLGDGECDGAYNSSECGFDGGDCLIEYN